jgi:hypothetical protein
MKQQATPPTEAKTYNGWKNRETWNVALWIQNDQALYELARRLPSYESFCCQMDYPEFSATPDGVKWRDPAIDVEALDRMMEEL